MAHDDSAAAPGRITNLAAVRHHVGELRTMLADDDELRARTMGYLGGEMGDSEHISLRIAARLLERLDELRPWVEGRGDLAPTGTVSRSDLVRLAVLRGLEQLERERRKEAPE